MRANADAVTDSLHQELRIISRRRASRCCGRSCAGSRMPPRSPANMLRRQQARAVVAARSRIVEGAVGMATWPSRVSRKNIVQPTKRRRPRWCEPLRRLCGESRAQPIVNTGDPVPVAGGQAKEFLLRISRSLRASSDGPPMSCSVTPNRVPARDAVRRAGRERRAGAPGGPERKLAPGRRTTSGRRSSGSQVPTHRRRPPSRAPSGRRSSCRPPTSRR